DAAQLEEAIVGLGLQHHLVSEFTSLVAIDDTPVRPQGVDGRSEQAPTSAPAGSYWAHTTGFARTATSAPLTLLVGTALLCIAIFLYFLGRFHDSSSARLCHSYRVRPRSGLSGS